MHKAYQAEGARALVNKAVQQGTQMDIDLCNTNTLLFGLNDDIATMVPYSILTRSPLHNR